MDKAMLKTQFGITAYVVDKNVEGFSHDDSLKQPAPGGNCANWVLGHMVKARNGALALV